MNWNKILDGASDDMQALLQEHSEQIEKTYNDADDSKGVDINLKLTIKPGKDNAVSVKSGISFAPERIKATKTRNVTEQGELFVASEDPGSQPGEPDEDPMGEGEAGDDPASGEE